MSIFRNFGLAADQVKNLAQRRTTLFQVPATPCRRGEDGRDTQKDPGTRPCFPSVELGCAKAHKSRVRLQCLSVGIALDATSEGESSENPRDFVLSVQNTQCCNKVHKLHPAAGNKLHSFETTCHLLALGRPHTPRKAIMGPHFSSGSSWKGVASSAPRLPWPRQCQEPRQPTNNPSGDVN